jgi:hypothetical protein
LLSCGGTPGPPRPIDAEELLGLGPEGQLAEPARGKRRFGREGLAISLGPGEGHVSPGPRGAARRSSKSAAYRRCRAPGAWPRAVASWLSWASEWEKKTVGRPAPWGRPGRGVDGLAPWAGLVAVRLPWVSRMRASHVQDPPSGLAEWVLVRWRMLVGCMQNQGSAVSAPHKLTALRAA